MNRSEKKKTVKIDLVNLEKEMISAQAMVNVVGASGCRCLNAPGLGDEATVITTR